MVGSLRFRLSLGAHALSQSLGPHDLRAHQSPEGGSASPAAEHTPAAHPALVSPSGESTENSVQQASAATQKRPAAPASALELAATGSAEDAYPYATFDDLASVGERLGALPAGAPSGAASPGDPPPAAGNPYAYQMQAASPYGTADGLGPPERASAGGSRYAYAVQANSPYASPYRSAEEGGSPHLALADSSPYPYATESGPPSPRISGEEARPHAPLVRPDEPTTAAVQAPPTPVAAVVDQAPANPVAAAPPASTNPVEQAALALERYIASDRGGQRDIPDVAGWLGSQPAFGGVDAQAVLDWGERARRFWVRSRTAYTRDGFLDSLGGQVGRLADGDARKAREIAPAVLDGTPLTFEDLEGWARATKTWWIDGERVVNGPGQKGWSTGALMPGMDEFDKGHNVQYNQPGSLERQETVLRLEAGRFVNATTGEEAKGPDLSAMTDDEVRGTSMNFFKNRAETLNKSGMTGREAREQTIREMRSSPRLIFVMDASGQFYATQGELHKIHHSTLLAGAKVAAAGEIGLTGGVPTLISNHSGHYMPGPKQVWQVVAELSYQGAKLAGMQVEMFGLPRTVDAQWFLDNFDGTKDGVGGLSPRKEDAVRQVLFKMGDA